MGIRELTALGLLCLAAPAMAATLPGGITTSEQTQALKSALNVAMDAAVKSLGRPDGFLGNPEVRIPLPGKLEKARRTLRKLGLSKDVDELATAMNRAAEAAVPEARALFAESIRQMTVDDALAILTGPQDAATRYLQSSMSAALTEKFLPIVGKATQQVELARHYDDVAGRASALGLIDPQDAQLDRYVTRRALDGLFATMAKEEAAIRKDPLKQADALLRRVFGAIGKP